MSIYQKRWSSCGSGSTPSRSTPTATNVLSSGVEPSTVGTSWNSVRWNKPSTSYRANLASRFENNTASSYTPPRTSRFLSSAAKNAADVASIGPSVSARASRFDTSNMPNKEKYRSEARDLINKWSSRERNPIGNTFRSPVQRSTFRSTDALSSSAPSALTNTAYRTSTSLTPTRTSLPSRYSTERRSVVSPSPTPVQLHTTPKADRPWRQRMAEASRIRSTLGDDYRSRQSSVESSIFTPSTRFTTSSYVPYSLKSYGIDRSASRSKSPTRDSLPMRSTSHVPKNPSIREDSKERDAEKAGTRKKSVRERTARRNSRQNSQQDSSSDEEICRLMRSRSGSQQRRKSRKKSQVDTPSTPNKMQSSLYETGAEEMLKSVSSAITASLAESIHALAVAAESEEFQSCAASPLAPSISRSSSKNGVVKNQIIKSPSIVEVHGLPRSESKTSVKPSESSKLDDESQYSAIAHFKPKRIAPVPGMWKKSGTENEEFISRNKLFTRDPQIGEAHKTIIEKRRETGIKKTVKAVEKKLILKTRVDPPKDAQEATKKNEPKVPVSKPVSKPVEKSEKPPAKVEKQEPKEAPKIAKAPSKEEKKVEEKKDPPKLQKSESMSKKTEKTAKKNEEEKKEIKTPGVEKKKVLLTRKKKIIPLDEPIKKVEEPPKPLTEKSVEISKAFSKRSWSGQKAEKCLKLKRVERKELRCRACTNATTLVDEHYRRRALSERATVLVDTPIKDLNHCVVKASIREKRVKKRISPPPVAVVNPVVPPFPVEESVSRPVSCTSRASVILDEMRYTEAAVEWTRDAEQNDDDALNELLILPDKSILEQYVNRKRGKLDRYRGVRPSSMCSSRGYESSNCASPCPSTVSELCVPSSVVVHEPRKRAPNSAEPSSSTPSLSLNSIPRGFTKNHVEAPPVIKPVPFEAPKTLFEKMIQDQAKRNRNSTHSLSAQSDGETRDPSPNRRGSQEEGMSAISQQFTAAVGNAGHGQARYAAHLPVRNSSDGRMSSTSVDSQQSGGALDVATKNIDHVIDQARHRHHQHRSKFKEAIDYLDQIFEDLKKECDSDDKSNGENETKKKMVEEPTQPAVSQKTKSAAVKSQVIKPVQPEAPPKKSTTKPAAAAVKLVSQKPQQEQKENRAKVKPAQFTAQTDSPVEVVIPVRKISASNENQSPTITETVVLAKKTDKMDFTRRWLQDDLSSLAHLPPANIAPNASYYQDFDEHSLGSCSAEVAAFNTVKDRKNSKPSRKTSDTSDTFRVRPFRPQPIYPDPSGTSFSSNTLPRVTSTDDAYNTLRSMRSEGGGGEMDSLRPSPSAFQQVSGFNRSGSMRSSLRSLPDHSPIRYQKQRIDEGKDPILSIDQLVAELELNTDQPTSSAEKRRSFPTSFVRPTPHRAQYHQPSGGNEYEKPNRYRAEMKHAPTRGRGGFVANEQPIYSQPAPSSSSNRPQRSLDEVTNMLNKVVSQFGNDRPQVYKQTSFGSTHSGNAFETINQEKINPSRVEAMHNMFEKGTAPTAWKIHQPSASFERSKMSPLQESQYATLHSYSPSNNNNNNNSNGNANPIVRNASQISYHEYTPQLPMTQPPQRPPGSANSSQGGYYSSNSSGIGSNYPQQAQQGVQQQYPPNNNVRRSTLIDQQSISSRVPSMDDDDDGFYDNIGIYNDDRRFSRGSEQLDYRQLPPSSSSSHLTSKEPKHNRIGSFLRKIGATSRPPGSAASLMSLNKIANETVVKPAALMKSNSLSTEPWKRQILEANSSMPKEANNNSNHHHNHHKTGLGARLKNSLFGSRKRLDG